MQSAVRLVSSIQGHLLVLPDRSSSIVVRVSTLHLSSGLFSSEADFTVVFSIFVHGIPWIGIFNQYIMFFDFACFVVGEDHLEEQISVSSFCIRAAFW